MGCCAPSLSFAQSRFATMPGNWNADQLCFWESRKSVIRFFQREDSLFELIVLILVVQWLFSFFGQAIFPRILHTGGFIYFLSVVIFSLIGMRFLSWL